MPSRVVAMVTAIVALALAMFAVWTNMAGIGHAANRIGLPVPAATTTTEQPGPTSSDTAADDPRLGVASQPAPPLMSPMPVNVPVQGFLAWALLDRQSGAISGSANLASATNSTESMIKAWISSDYLRRIGDTAPVLARLSLLTRMIRDSDDNAAEIIYDIGGYNSVIQRMITICALTETSIFDGWWSRTQMSARDAVRLGACIADGRAAGPRWTDWILGEMRQVRGEGRFGIIEALPAAVAAQTAIKNGWTIIGNQWHLNCLAIIDRYVLSVLTRYPASLGIGYGAGVCRNVATQVQPSG